MTVYAPPGTVDSTIEVKSRYGHYIGGEWVDSETKIDVRDPSTDEVFATIASATLDDAERAIAAARECVKEGRLTRERPAQRAEW